MRHPLVLVPAILAVVFAGACSYLKNLNCADIAVLGSSAPMVMGMTPAAPLSPVMPLLGALYAENVCKAAVSVASQPGTPVALASTASSQVPGGQTK